jgi:hypothetical protein
MDLPKDFNIDRDSAHLKSLCARHDPEVFIGDIANLIRYIDAPRIEIDPFFRLDSPFRQLTYMAALNLTSDTNAIETDGEVSNPEWTELVKYCLAVKAGYFDLLLPKEGDEPVAYYDLYKVAMPVFMDFYNAGSLNYEEQIIDRITTFFTPFDSELEQQFGLKTADFVAIYNLIDNEMYIRENYPMTTTRSDEDCRSFWETQVQKDVHPLDWKYEGNKESVAALVKYMANKNERFTIEIIQVKKSYDPEKVDRFFSLFSISRATDPYNFYTTPNPVLLRPLFRRKDSRYLVIDVKQVITAVYNMLTQFLTHPKNNLEERFYKRRGKALQEKVKEIFKRYFKNDYFIYNEYAVTPHGDGQDLLILFKGLALIIEAKAGREPEPMRDVRKSFEKIAISFKKNVQEGYAQSYRIKKLFDQGATFDLYDERGNYLYRVNTKKYHNYFSVIVTLAKFREPQINLNHLLDMEPGDDRYPFSVSIDDLEIILLAMTKLKKGPGNLIRFLHIRDQLQGRLRCNDETELWGKFMNDDKFKVPDDENIHFQTFPEMAAFYDELYKKGLGFVNEKNMDKKRSKRYLFYDAADIK